MTFSLAAHPLTYAHLNLVFKAIHSMPHISFLLMLNPKLPQIQQVKTHIYCLRNPGELRWGSCSGSQKVKVKV